MNKFLLSFVLALSGIPIFAQESTQEHIAPAANQSAINATHIAEIYGEAFLENKPQLRTALMDLLSNRVSYLLEPVYAGEKYPLLSSLPLMNQLNPDIHQHDPAQFDVTTFNPLTYSWNFFDNRIQVFRIDGTDYLLVVQPQPQPQPEN